MNEKNLRKLRLSDIAQMMTTLHNGIDELEKENEALREQIKKPCTWSPRDKEFNIWETECQELHQFIAGGPKENHYRFCPYCGGEIRMNHKGGES